MDNQEQEHTSPLGEIPQEEFPIQTPDSAVEVPILTDAVATPLEDFGPAAIVPKADSVENGELPPVELGELEVTEETATVYPTTDTLRRPADNTVQTDDVYRDEQLNVAPNAGEQIPILPTTRDDVLQILENNPDLEKEKSEYAERHARLLAAALDLIPLGSQYDATVARVGAQWKQHLETAKGTLGYQVPKFSADKEGVRGQDANIRLRALMGMGSLVTVPLVHSGFSVTLTTPSDSSIIEVRRRLMDDKIDLGRQTHGLVFSNTSSYATGWLLDLVMDNLYSTTLKDRSTVRQSIKTPDLPLLFWGLACAIWPKGFPYVRSDLGQKGVRNKDFHSGLLDVKKLLWIDNGSFTEAQRAHMSNRQVNSVTATHLEEYQKGFPISAGRVVELGIDGDNPIKVHLSVPSADAHIRSGNRWISELVAIVERTFTGDREDFIGRRDAIFDHANATIMRQYGHWISAVEIDGRMFEDEETLDTMIGTFAQHPENRAKLSAEIATFIDDCTVALVALPEPTGQEVGPKRFPRLIPLDVVAVFFTLLIQRTNRIMVTKTN